MSVRVRGKKFKMEFQQGSWILNLANQGITSIAEIEGLSQLSNLQGLVLPGNPINKIEGLDQLHNLQGFWASGAQISRIEGLDHVPNLKGLTLTENQITKIEGLDHVPNLEQINLYSNRIAKIEGLDHVPNLFSLCLDNNRIAKIEGLDNLPNLMSLHLDNNQITKIEGMEHLVGLKYNVTLKNNPVAWPPGLLKYGQEGQYAEAQDIVAYCQQASAAVARERAEADRRRRDLEERQKLEAGRPATLKKIVKVSKSMLLDDLARALSITRDDLMVKIIDWAAEFGFEIDGNQVIFGTGRKDDFLAKLDKEFSSWGKETGGKI